VTRYLEPTLRHGKLRNVLRSSAIGPRGKVSNSAARAVPKGWLGPLNEGSYSPIESASFDTLFEEWERDLLPTGNRRGSSVNGRDGAGLNVAPAV
jgi:hypothetical protein